MLAAADLLLYITLLIGLVGIFWLTISSVWRRSKGGPDRFETWTGASRVRRNLYRLLAAIWLGVTLGHFIPAASRVTSGACQVAEIISAAQCWFPYEGHSNWLIFASACVSALPSAIVVLTVMIMIVMLYARIVQELWNKFDCSNRNRAQIAAMAAAEAAREAEDADAASAEKEKKEEAAQGVCTFHFLRADFVRNLPDDVTRLPRMQDLQVRLYGA